MKKINILIFSIILLSILIYILNTEQSISTQEIREPQELSQENAVHNPHLKQQMVSNQTTSSEKTSDINFNYPNTDSTPNSSLSTVGYTQDSIYLDFISESIQNKLSDINIEFLNSFCSETECEIIFQSKFPFNGDLKLQNNIILELAAIIDSLDYFSEELHFKQDSNNLEQITFLIQK